jgi:hypothetical protein
MDEVKKLGSPEIIAEHEAFERAISDHNLGDQNYLTLTRDFLSTIDVDEAPKAADEIRQRRLKLAQRAVILQRQKIRHREKLATEYRTYNKAMFEALGLAGQVATAKSIEQLPDSCSSYPNDYSLYHARQCFVEQHTRSARMEYSWCPNVINSGSDAAELARLERELRTAILESSGVSE